MLFLFVCTIASPAFSRDGEIRGRVIHLSLRFQEIPLWFRVVLAEFSSHGEAPPLMHADLAEDSEKHNYLVKSYYNCRGR